MEPTTPNGTSYNLRGREKRTLSHSFRSTESESPPPFEQKRQRSNSRSATKKVPPCGQIKGRPAIRKNSILPNPFAFHDHFERERPITGSIPPKISSSPPPQPPVADSSAKYDEPSSLTCESSSKDADNTFLKTPENSSLTVNASDDSVSPGLPSSRDSDNGNSWAGNTPGTGSAQFLDATTFYGSSSNLNRNSLSPRMGTLAVRQRSPMKTTPVIPMVSLVSSALPAFASTSSNHSKKNIRTSCNENGNPSSTPKSMPRMQQLPTPRDLFGPDLSPSAGRSVPPVAVGSAVGSTGEFSDDDTAAETIQKPLDQRRPAEGPVQPIVGPTGDEHPSIVVQPATGPRPDFLVIFMIIVAFLTLLGGLIKPNVDVKKDDSRASPMTEVATPEPQPPVQLPPVLDLVGFESRLMNVFGEMVAKNSAEIEETVKESLRSHADAVDKAKTDATAVRQRLAGIETAANELRAIQRMYGTELEKYEEEMSRLVGDQKDARAQLFDLRGSVPRLDKIVREIADKLNEMETALKNSIESQAGEVRALKALIHVANVPPSINETELFRKMESVREQIRSEIRADLVGVMREKLAEINDSFVSEFTKKSVELEKRLAHGIRASVAREITASLPVKDEKVYLEKEEALRLIEFALEKKRKLEDSPVDYALETQGGSVLEEHSSETFVESPSAWTLFGFPVWYVFCARRCEAAVWNPSD